MFHPCGVLVPCSTPELLPTLHTISSRKCLKRVKGVEWSEGGVDGREEEEVGRKGEVEGREGE